MNLFERVWRSSLGKKYIMAITGLGLFAFLIGHLIGNLQIFGSPDLINNYAHFLKTKPKLVWGARLGLLAILGLHIVSAVQLAAMNKAARPVGYEGGGTYGASRASRTMLISGLVILAFVIYHLAHFTALLPGVNGVGDFTKLKAPLHGEQVPDVYAMVILGFQVWWVVLFYLLAQWLLFTHLGHGLASLFQSLGLRNHVWWPRVQMFARVASIALFVGYSVIPISIYLRIVGADYAARKKYDLGANAGPAPVERLAAVEGKEGR